MCYCEASAVKCEYILKNLASFSTFKNIQLRANSSAGESEPGLHAEGFKTLAAPPSATTGISQGETGEKYIHIEWQACATNGTDVTDHKVFADAFLSFVGFQKTLLLLILDCCVVAKLCAWWRNRGGVDGLNCK